MTTTYPTGEAALVAEAEAICGEAPEFNRNNHNFLSCAACERLCPGRVRMAQGYVARLAAMHISKDTVTRLSARLIADLAPTRLSTTSVGRMAATLDSRRGAP